MFRPMARVLAVAAIAVPLTALAGGGRVNPIDAPQPKAFPDEAAAIVEIPAGSNIKYEVDADTGLVTVDRFILMPMAYPVNYGCVPSTMGGDNDPLDVLVYTREPVAPGVLIRVRPIGILKSYDVEEDGKLLPDYKVIAVPTSKVDPGYERVKSVDDLPALDRQRLEGFFKVYKDLPAGPKRIEVRGFGGIEEARKFLSEGAKRYRETRRAEQASAGR